MRGCYTARPVLSAELERYASEFECLAHGVEDMEQLLASVRRLSYFAHKKSPGVGA